MPGPVPKRSDQRRRRNKPEGPQLEKAPAGTEPTWPEPAEHWHPVATYWYLSLAQSGQSQFYEQSDIATAVYVAEAMHRSLGGERMSGQAFAAIMSAQADLLTTEAARRRSRIELERNVGPVAEDPKVAQMEKYRAAAGG